MSFVRLKLVVLLLKICHKMLPDNRKTKQGRLNLRKAVDQLKSLK